MRRNDNPYRAKRLIKRARKIFLFIMVMFFLEEGNSQINNLAYNDLMWSEDDPASKVTDVPDKWKGESAVVLYQYEQYSYKKKGMSSFVEQEYAIRLRIKILDETALSQYSEWSMSDLTNNRVNRDQEYVGMKVIKSNGSVYVISNEDLVKVENPIADKNGAASYFKIALPNLAVGDIIDYYYLSERSFPKQVGNDVFFDFDPEVILLAKSIPILKGKLSITPERLAYLNLKYLNGISAPKIEGDKNKTYVFEYGDVEKMEAEQMVFPFREYPSIVFQIVITNQYSAESTLNILGDKDDIKTSITEKNLYKFILKLTEKDRLGGYGLTVYKQCLRDLKKYKKANPSDSTLIEKAYNYIRHYLHFKDVYYMGQKVNFSYFVDKFDFILAYSAILDNYDIQYDLGLAIPRIYGQLEDIVVKNHLSPVIRIKGEYPIYISYPKLNSIFGVTDVLIEGSIFYHLDPASKSKIMFKDTIPLSSPTNNLEFDSIFVEIDSIDPGKLVVNYMHYCYGNSKVFYNEYFMTPIEVYNDELKHNTFSLGMKPDEIEAELELMQEILANNAEYNKYKFDLFHDFLKQSYMDDNLELDSIELLEAGRYMPDKPLTYRFNCKVTNGTQQAGKFTIVELGRLIGKNKNFTTKELDRKSNIYLDAAQQVNWALIFNIPEGYTLKKYDNLEYDISNNAGSFISTVKHSENRLIVDISKTYFKHYYPNSEWGEILEFLKAAVDFTQQQILLEKIN